LVEADFDAVSQPLWDYLDLLTPKLWRSGRAYPQNSGRQRTLMGDGEIDLAMSFSPSEASAAIANGELPDSVRTAVFDAGTIGNASHKAGTMVLADFLRSPEAQAHKQDPGVWGGFTVLAVDRLPAAERRRFDALDLGIATLSPQQLGKVLPEPHPSWMIRIEEAWTQRYGAQ
jgi:putative thiamine transport system substrate-binding protein